jgi:hypothetical protein
MNTDDRLDPAYCPDGNAIPDYQSWIFDIAGRLEQSYWAPYAEYGYPYGFFDVVENGICSGAIRVRTQGYNRPENACPILPDDYYYKVGLPDFTQYYPGVPGPAYCGPVAGANSVWWFACIDSQFTPSWGGCNPGDEIALINEIAAAAGTNPILGTNCDSLEAAIIKVVKAHGGWNFIETTVYAPEFWYLQYQLRICEDVVLLLGFWQFDGANWTRFGGHFVTLAGVDYTNYAFAFSDPATPTVIDKYFVAWPSVSPGGIVWIPDYYLPWPDFQGQNAGPLPNTGPYNPQLPVVVEVEQAIVVSPGPLKMYGTVHSGVLPVWPDSIRAFEKEDNRGSIDDFGKDFNKDGLIFDALYGGSLIVGTTQENLNCDYGDFVPLRTFVPLGPPVCTSFVVIGSAGPYTIEQCTYKFAHSFIPGLIINKYAFGFWVPVGGTEECEQVIEDVFVLENTGTDPIICLEKAVWLDFDISAGGTSDQSYGSQPFQSKWMWNAGAPDSVYGLTKIPVGTKAITGWGLSQPDRVYDGQYLDSLKYWMENLGWGDDNDLIAMDRSILIADACFDLAPVGMPGSMHINKWLKWGFEGLLFPQADTTVYPAQYAKWRHFLYNILHQEGFYRGDVNQDEWLDVNDVVFLKKYLAGGQPPIEFIDQGDVNCDGNVDNADLVYLKAFLCKGGGGPAPIDKNRFLLNSPFVDPAHKALGTRNPGLFGDPDWADLSGGVEKFRCGDANGNDKVLVDDVIYLINYLFKGGPAPIDVSDVNLDGKVLVDDVIYLINWLFKGGPAPCGCP